jgi:hypothetical protein
MQVVVGFDLEVSSKETLGFLAAIGELKIEARKR